MFKAVLIIAYITCAAVAGVVTGYGGAYCYNRLSDDGLPLIFDARDKYERIYAEDKLQEAVRSCTELYNDNKTLSYDYSWQVNVVPFGLSITDENGNEYSNGMGADTVTYSVSLIGGEHEIENKMASLSIGLRSGYIFFDGMNNVINYELIMQELPFDCEIIAGNNIYGTEFDPYSYDMVTIQLVPEVVNANINADAVTLIFPFDSISGYINVTPPKTEDYLSAIDGLDFYCKVTAADGSVYENGVPHEKAVGYNSSTDKELIGINYSYLFSDVTVGLSEEENSALSQKYSVGVHNMRVIIITDICMLLLGTAILIFLCRVIGESPSGDISLPPVLTVFYEITAGALVFGFVFGVDGFVSRYYDAAVDHWQGGILMMAVTGLAAAGIAGLWLYLWLCLSARSKNGVFARGSLVYRFVSFLWRCIKRAFGFLRDLFTGKFIGGRAAKRLMWTDVVFLIATAVDAVLFLLCASAPSPGSAPSILFLAMLISLEVVFLVLFISARFILTRDMSRLERQIEDVYLGKGVSSAEFSESSPFRQSGERLERLGEQYRRGMEERMRAERMKIDLVTNVSHDLKTPLTSIISYIDLLSKEELPPAAEDYVKILQSKSERLKNIVSDVFDLAKATSGEITAERSPLDLSKLSYQALADMEDRIAASGFEVKRSICDPPVVIMSDGKRIYRIIQNLLDNALKYSTEGTRIHYTLEKTGGRALLTIKNISAAPLDLTADELTERFVRGDRSRSTEGSGLGLSIAQGFALACGGELKIDIDGDMFRAAVSFPLANN